MKGRGGVGGGGMLTFLVLLPLHVVTLHRCLVALLRCIHVALLNICMYIYICESAYPSPAKTNSTLKRLL